LELMGWIPYWRYQRDKDYFRFEVTHFGRNYHVNLNTYNGQVQVGEAPKGFFSVINGLHFFNGNIPNAPLLLRSWAVFQWLTLLTMLVSLIVGIWLWLRFSYKKWEGLVFGGLVVFTLFIMMLI